MHDFDPATVGQLHPQGSIPPERRSADRRGAADNLHGKDPVLHPSDEALSLKTLAWCGLLLCRRRLQSAATPAILIQSRDRQSMLRAENPPRQSALCKLQRQPLGLFSAATTTHGNTTHFAHAIRTSQQPSRTEGAVALTDTFDPLHSARHAATFR